MMKDLEAKLAELEAYKARIETKEKRIEANRKKLEDLANEVTKVLKELDADDVPVLNVKEGRKTLTLYFYKDKIMFF